MKLETTRFGPIEIAEDEIYSFPEGLLGFASFKRFILKPNPTGGPMLWLQSVDDGSLAFIICQPQLFKPDYKVSLRPEDLGDIELTKVDEALIYAVMVIPKDKPREMTANLQGPLILNKTKRLGKQFVLLNSDYSTKYKVFQE
ncbi:MAG: flagellar assembly protein FliW [Planctomycetes bacterium]|nr:flagellar assembly protein FliW [Planctomycetota bacterium]